MSIAASPGGQGAERGAGGRPRAERRAEGVVYGYYNDYTFEVDGDVHARALVLSDKASSFNAGELPVVIDPYSPEDDQLRAAREAFVPEVYDDEDEDARPDYGLVCRRLHAGEAVFRQCLPCHSVGEGAKNKVGPELNGIDGRKAGSAPGYSYSEANKNSGITWDETTFKEYIRDPRAKVPGTKMTYPGITGEDADKKIANLWAYIKQFKADGSK